MMSQTTTQTITINVLPDISKSNRQSNNEIWTVDRIQRKKYFFSKNQTENEAGKQVTDPFFS